MRHDVAARDRERAELLAVNHRVLLTCAGVVAPLVAINLGLEALRDPVWQRVALFGAALLMNALWAVALCMSRRGRLEQSAALAMYAALCFDAVAIALRQQTFVPAAIASVGMSLYGWVFAPRLGFQGAVTTFVSLAVMRLLIFFGVLPGVRPTPLLAMLLDMSIISTALPVILYFLYQRARISDLPFQALVGQQRWLEAVVRQLPIPLVIVDPADNRTVIASADGERVIGSAKPCAPAPEAPAPNASATGPSSEAAGPAGVCEAIIRAAMGDPCEGEETRWRTPSGETVDGLCFARMLPPLHGQQQTAMVALLDVTRLKRVQDELQRALASKEDFLSAASHELRTPLTALALQLDSMTRTAAAHSERMDRAWLQGKVEALERQTGRLTHLVNGLLDVSRIEAGRFELSPEPLELRGLASEVMARLQHEAAAAGSEVRLSSGGEIPGSWDRSCLDLVLTNLLSNAIKYGAGKPIELSASASGGLARVTVVDHGAGIAPELIGRLFHRFERLSTTQGGFGLGLWIAHALVERMGGRIEVESVVEQGSRFTVMLPLEARAARETREVCRPAAMA